MNTRQLILPLALILFAPILAVPRQYVLVELFTSTGCTGCPGAAWGLDDLVSNGHPVAPMTDHVNDTFENRATEERYAYYEVTGTPTVFFDGLDPCNIPSSGVSLYPEYLARLEARMLVPSKYELSAYGALDGLTCSTAVDITKAEADSNSNVVLHLAVTETAIPFNWWPDNRVVNFVNRIMVPDFNGTPVAVESLPLGGQLSLDLSFALKEEWVQDNLAVVVWLQNTLTKEILQSAKYSLADLTRLRVPEPVASLDGSDLRLDWDPVPFATSYAISRCDTPDGPFEYAATVDGPLFMERLGSNPHRFYRVQALRD